MELLICERPNFARLAFPNDGGLITARRGEMPVKTVVAEIDLAADEPLRPRQVPLEDFLPRAEPMQLLCDAAPELLGVRFGIGAHLLVLRGTLDQRALAELLRRVKATLLVQYGFDIGGRRLGVGHRASQTGKIILTTKGTKVHEGLVVLFANLARFAVKILL